MPKPPTKASAPLTSWEAMDSFDGLRGGKGWVFSWGVSKRTVAGSYFRPPRLRPDAQCWIGGIYE